jgi:tRNA threonylcarbamoyladenosine biosynthesis protein TsaE
MAVISKDQLPEFAKVVLQKMQPKENGAFLIFLSGNLGSGKTTFMQAFARGLGVADTIQSPTFVLMKKYVIGGSRQENEAASTRSHLKTTPQLLRRHLADAAQLSEAKGGVALGSPDVKATPHLTSQFTHLVHIDAYRLENDEEFGALKPEEFLRDPKNIVAIEWTENINDVLPQPDLILTFSSEGMGEGERLIEIQKN